jgi:hypothetical protein
MISHRHGWKTSIAISMAGPMALVMAALLAVPAALIAVPLPLQAQQQTRVALPAGAIAGQPIDATLSHMSESLPALPAYPLHTGWPVAVQGGASPPVCANLDPAYPGLEIVVGTLTSAPNLYVFHQDGTLMTGYPVDLGFFIAASPSIADINNDGLPEIVVGDWGGSQVWALRANGTALPGWPIVVGGNVRSTAALADLDPTYPGLEIIVGVQDGTVQAWHFDGTAVAGWPVHAGNFVERSSPAVGDADGDGDLEVFVGSWYDYGATSTGGVYGFDHTGAALPGWPKLTAAHTSVIASPALVDLDHDGFLEIIVGTYETAGKMYVWRLDGTDQPGWPYTIPRAPASTSLVSSSPAVGDLDGDGELEIVDGSCGQCGTVYAWRRNGTVMPGWPVVTNAVIDGSSPVLGDVNGDGAMDVVIGSGSGFTPNGCTAGAISKAYILQANGTVMSGWPVDLGTAAPPNPAIADVDLDGNVEVIISYSQSVYVWDAPGAFDASKTPWPYYHLGIDHTGCVPAVDPAAAGEITAANPAVPVLAWPNPAQRGASIDIGGGTDSRLTIWDAGGRLVRSLTGAEWDGRDALGRRVPAGVYWIRGDRGIARAVITP